jgi:hypothetical protein
MSDHCHMSVKCRREDRARFEALGFQIAWGEKENTPVIEMIDEEANYAHYNDMPANIPYYGTWAAGDNYGPGRLVCDGKNYETVAANDDGFVIAWHYRFGLPTLKSILEIRRYLKIEKRVQKLFKALEPELPPQHLFSPDTSTCVKCGISADDDAVENTSCIK